MPRDTFVYYSPELMVLLFVAAVTLGLIIGYLLWGSRRAVALEKEQQAAELRQRLDSLRGEGTALRDEIRMVG